MENMSPASSSSTYQPEAKEKPFAQTIVELSKQQYIQFKWNNRYWQRQHERAIVREAALKLQLEQAEATIRDLKQRLYGKRMKKPLCHLKHKPEIQRLRVLMDKRWEARAMVAPLDHSYP